MNRYNGQGSFPLCLAAHPLSPVNSKTCFRIDKAPGEKTVALGVCIENVVKSHNYLNCGAFGKGIYAIDQNNPLFYGMGDCPMASWNHHDTSYNQSHQGSGTDLVVCMVIDRDGG